jgi:c-di-GMP-related signal transduction protein
MLDVIEVRRIDFDGVSLNGFMIQSILQRLSVTDNVTKAFTEEAARLNDVILLQTQVIHDLAETVTTLVTAVNTITAGSIIRQ